MGKGEKQVLQLSATIKTHRKSHSFIHTQMHSHTLTQTLD